VVKVERGSYFLINMIQHFIRLDRASRSRREASRIPLFIALALGVIAVAILLATFGGR